MPPQTHPLELEGLRAAVDSFSRLAREAPAHPAPPSGWGLHEVLSHLVFWHEHYVRLVEAGLAGCSIRRPVGTFKELNAAAVGALASEPVEQLATRLERAQHELERLTAGGRGVALMIRIKDGTKPWPWPEFVKRVEGHIRGHERELRHRLAA